MADRSHDRVDPADAELAAMSAALDDEGPEPPDPTARAAAFAESSRELRRAVRVTEAEPVPDLTESVLAAIDDIEHDSTRRWKLMAAVAAAFVVGAGVAAMFTLDRDLQPTSISASELRDDLVTAHVALDELDATVRITERGVHPSVPERTYTGVLRYRAPESLYLEIDDVTDYPSDAWIDNDLAVVVDEDVAWRSAGLGCPVDMLPGCLGPRVTDRIVRRAPFSAGWAAPLDLVMPAGGVIDGTVPAQLVGDRVEILTTVAAARPLIEALIGEGAFRQVHASDVVAVELDADTLSTRRVAISAAGSSARALWATTWGYPDEVGAELIVLEVSPAVLSDHDLPTDDEASGGVIDAGFVDGSVDGALTPTELPAGLIEHRRGRQMRADGSSVEVATWTDGRAWLSVRAIEVAEGSASSTAERIDLDDGAIYVDRAENRVEMFTGRRRIEVLGSLPVDDLVGIAASIPIDRVAFEEPPTIDLPVGILIPPDVGSITVSGDRVTITSETADGETVVIVEQAGDLLDPPPKTDVAEVAVRDTTGRYSQTLSTLTWAENGYVIEIRARDAGLPALAALARSMLTR